MNATLLILGCVCAQPTSPATTPPDQFLDLIRRDAVPKWSSYTEMIQQCELNCRYDIRHFTLNGNPVADHPADRVIDATTILLKDFGSQREVTSSKKLTQHDVACFNTKYAFELRGSAADKLSLKEIVNPITPEAVVPRVIRAGVIARCVGWMVLDKPLNELWADPSFALEPVRQNTRGNYVVPFRQSKDGFTARFEIELNPNRGWRVESNKSTMTMPDRERTEEMTYENDGFPVPIPSRYVFNETNARTNQRGQVVVEVTRFQANPRHAEEEFMLSAFGLPEPVGVVWTKPTPRYVWFLAGAAVLVVMAVGFRYLARRRAGPSPA